MPNFNLTKGSSFELKKAISSVYFGLGWDENPPPGPSYDVDATAFGCSNKKMFDADGSHVVGYFNKPLKQPNGSYKTADGSLTHSGDNKTGSAQGDDEQIVVNLNLLPAAIDEIMFFITIYDSKARKQDFGHVSNAYIQLKDATNGTELCRYNLTKEYSNDMAVQIGSMIKEYGVWSFKALGVGYPDKEIGDVIGILS